jgi:hypothetical protein
MGMVAHVFTLEAISSIVSPQCQWEHTPQELQNILAKLKKESHPFSLQKECLHIIKNIQKNLSKYIWETTHPIGSSQQGFEPLHDPPLLLKSKGTMYG